MFHRPEKMNPQTVKNPATPAQRAEAVWDRRVGNAVTQAYNWRRATILFGCACVVLAGGLVVQSLKTQVIPYVVTVDKSTGEVEKAGAFVGQDYTPKEAEVKYFISNFIRNARSIQLDPVAQNQSQAMAQAFLTKNAASKYAAVQQNEGYANKFGKVTVTVQIKTIQQIPDSESSYQVRWTEEEFGIQSGAKNIVNKSGIFTYTIIPVKEEEQLLRNPLGLYISGFDFSNDASDVTKK